MQIYLFEITIYLYSHEKRNKIKKKHGLYNIEILIL